MDLFSDELTIVPMQRERSAVNLILPWVLIFQIQLYEPVEIARLKFKP